MMKVKRSLEKYSTRKLVAAVGYTDKPYQTEINKRKFCYTGLRFVDGIPDINKDT